MRSKRAILARPTSCSTGARTEAAATWTRSPPARDRDLRAGRGCPVPARRRSARLLVPPSPSRVAPRVRASARCRPVALSARGRLARAQDARNHARRALRSGLSLSASEGPARGAHLAGGARSPGPEAICCRRVADDPACLERPGRRPRRAGSAEHARAVPLSTIRHVTPLRFWSTSNSTSTRPSSRLSFSFDVLDFVHVPLTSTSPSFATPAGVAASANPTTAATAAPFAITLHAIIVRPPSPFPLPRVPEKSTHEAFPPTGEARAWDE